jgi:hypothetical protein
MIDMPAAEVTNQQSCHQMNLLKTLFEEDSLQHLYGHTEQQ